MVCVSDLEESLACSLVLYIFEGSNAPTKVFLRALVAGRKPANKKNLAARETSTTPCP
jgi:hypothetical protein